MQTKRGITAPVAVLISGAMDDIGRGDDRAVTATGLGHVKKVLLSDAGLAKQTKKVRVSRCKGGVNRLVGIAHPYIVTDTRCRIGSQNLEQFFLLPARILRLIFKNRKHPLLPLLANQGIGECP